MLFVFLLGTAVGSFLNVLIDRLPNEESIHGRSHCNYCKRTLKWFELIPLFSFLFLRGTCRTCKKPIPPVYFFVELLTGVAFVAGFWSHPVFGGIPQNDVTPKLSSWLVQDLVRITTLTIISSLIVIFFADAKYQIIPDSIQFILLLSVLVLFLLTGYTVSMIFVQIISGFAIMAPILAIYLFTKGKGMGFGDVKLSFTIGFFMGILKGFLVLYIGFITGAVVGLLLIFLNRKKLKQTIAFGPFLVVGLMVMVIYGEEVVRTARRIYGM